MRKFDVDEVCLVGQPSLSLKKNPFQSDVHVSPSFLLQSQKHCWLKICLKALLMLKFGRLRQHVYLLLVTRGLSKLQFEVPTSFHLGYMKSYFLHQF